MSASTPGLDNLRQAVTDADALAKNASDAGLALMSANTTIASLSSTVADLRKQLAATTSVPSGIDPKWVLVFAETFDLDVAEGHFLAAYNGKWDVYPRPWQDTSKRGTYSGDYISVLAGRARARLFTPTAGVPQCAALLAKIGGANPYQGQVYGRSEVTMRADVIAGYKVVPMWWPTPDNYPAGGELDFPETDLDASAPVHANTHWYGAKLPADGQVDPFTAAGVSIHDWHTYTTEWTRDAVRYFADGELVGATTTGAHVPASAMRYLLQFETNTSQSPVPPAAAGYVEVDSVRLWSLKSTNS